jgi:hypothetical protein
MSIDNDPVVVEVLRRARAQAAPAASDLEGVLARVRSQIAAAPVVLHEVPEPDAPLARGGAGARVPGRGALQWTAELRRWSGTVLSLGIGFAIGVQYADHRSRPEVPLVSPSATLGAGDSLAMAPPAAPSEPMPLLEPRPEATSVPALPGRTSAPLDSAVSTPKAKRRSLAVPARSSSRTRATTAAPQEALSFAQVVERLEQAQRAERDLSPEVALRLLDELDAHADAAALRQERLATRVLAACDLGDVAAAQRAARELETVDPGSVYASRLGGSCIALKAADTSSVRSTR